MHSRMNDTITPPIGLVDDLLMKMLVRDGMDSTEEALRELELANSKVLAEVNVPHSIEQLRCLVSQLVESDATWDSKVWGDALDFIDRIENRERQRIESLFVSAEILVRGFDGIDRRDLSDRIADINDAWVEKANTWTDEFLALRAKLSAEESRRTPEDKKTGIMESATDVDAAFAKMLP